MTDHKRNKKQSKENTEAPNHSFFIPCECEVFVAILMIVLVQDPLHPFVLLLIQNPLHHNPFKNLKPDYKFWGQNVQGELNPRKNAE